MPWFKKTKKETPIKAEQKVVQSAVSSDRVAEVVAANDQMQAKKTLTQLIKHPIISEKATRLQSLGQYTFKVSFNTSKIVLKKEVENLYKVNVIKVTSVKLPKKIVINRGRSGQRPIRKYMRVQLKSGQNINLTQI